MRTIVLIVAMLIAGPAFAQTAALNEEDVATARALMENSKQADNTANAKDADVSAIVINLQVNNAERGAGSAVIGLVPSDPEFATVLAAIKGVAVKRKQEADAKLGAMGLSRKPAAPAAPGRP